MDLVDRRQSRFSSDSAQKTAVGEAMAQLTDPGGLEFFDLYSHRRQPQHAFVWLAQGQDTRYT
tara:strand:- start:411 stop:599 length:189 start_codon:yes stop_codon:yes gene_type:complete